jgi:hypothetical protein
MVGSAVDTPWPETPTTERKAFGFSDSVPAVSRIKEGGYKFQMKSPPKKTQYTALLMKEFGHKLYFPKKVPNPILIPGNDSREGQFSKILSFCTCVVS